MAIAVNKNTTQSIGDSVGRSGSQVIKFIPAPRVYVKSVDSISSTPVQNYFNLSNGVTPAGFTDLGSVAGSAKVGYTAKVKEVTTGIDNYFRGAYLDGKSTSIEFSLGQFDDVPLELISQLVPVTSSDSSYANYQVGQNDLKQLALLLVVQDKLSSKEIQFYNPSAYLNFSFDESGDSLVIKTTGYLPFFVASGQTAESMLSVTVFNPNTPPPSTTPIFGFGLSPYGSIYGI